MKSKSKSINKDLQGTPVLTKDPIGQSKAETTTTSSAVKVTIKPIVKRYNTFKRTEANIGQSESEIIATSTVVKGKSNSLLLSNLEPQEESSEPLPQFSRNPLHGINRFENARKAAEKAAQE